MWSEKRSLVGAVLVAATLVCAGAPGQATEWQGMAIGQPGPGREKSFADAFHATGALARGGGRDVLMLRDVTPDAVMVALSAWPARRGAILYLSGVMEGDLLRLKGGDLPVSQVLGALAARQVTQLALLIEDCAGLADQPLAYDLSLPDGMQALVAATSGGAETCPQAEGRLTERLRAASVADSLQASLGDMVLFDDLGVAVPVAEQAAAAASPIIPAAPLAPLVQRDPVAVTPVSAVARGDTILSPVRAVARPQDTGSALLIFADPSDMQRAVLPRAAGLPEPSIIVGLVAPENSDSFGRAGDLGDLDLNDIAYDNLAARRGLQAQDPSLYASLVAAGAMDPPAGEMARALQQELARMGCYTTAVDGVWGNGSRAAVQRYFAERPEAEPVTLDPEAPLFRQIILQDDIACPAPQAATVRTPAPSQARSAQPTGARATQAAPQPQPAPQTGTRRIQSGTALGVFR